MAKQLKEKQGTKVWKGGFGHLPGNEHLCRCDVCGALGAHRLHETKVETYVLCQRPRCYDAAREMADVGIPGTLVNDEEGS